MRATLGAVVALTLASVAVVPLPRGQLHTAIAAVWELAAIPSRDVSACVEAYEYLVANSRSPLETDTREETEMVRKYYSVAQAVLAIADIEKMYIPPQADPREGVFGNQLLLEKAMVSALNVSSGSRVLDIGCGRGRVAQHVAELAGGSVAGFNVDERQVRHARARALESGLQERLEFVQGDFHDPFPYLNASFDGAYDMQALWGFTKKSDLPFAASEISRVLRPGGRFFSNTYALTSAFDWGNADHADLHSLFLPTLAATQSNYAADVAAALEGAGLRVLWSRPSSAPAWPLTDQKTSLFIALRWVAAPLAWAGLVPSAWLSLIDNLLRGGEAWKTAERAKVADLCWQIVAEKPV